LAPADKLDLIGDKRIRQKEGPTMRSVLLSLILVGACSPAFASTIVSWDFNDDNAIPDSIDANVTSTNFLAGIGLTNVAINDNAAARGWHNEASAAAALGAGNFWNFTVTADPGYLFDLTSLTFDNWQGTAGPDNFQAYVGGVLVGSAGTSTTTPSNYSVSLSNTGLSSILVQIVAWNADNNGVNANWFIDNVTLNGSVYPTVAAVPEPSVLCLFGLGFVGLAAASRNRRRKQQTPTA
jgi:hypothetical protein